MKITRSRHISPCIRTGESINPKLEVRKPEEGPTDDIGVNGGGIGEILVPRQTGDIRAAVTGLQLWAFETAVTCARARAKRVAPQLPQSCPGNFVPQHGLRVRRGTSSLTYMQLWQSGNF